MKKIIALILILCVLVFAGCAQQTGEEDKEAAADTTAEDTVQQVADEEPAVVDEPEAALEEVVASPKPEPMLLSDDKIVYGTSLEETGMTVEEMEVDCSGKGGKYSECGSPCAKGAEYCIEVCAYTCEFDVESDDMVASIKAKDDTAAELANPASINCLEDGGDLKLIQWPEGTVGMCIFDGKSVCEEWAYFNGKCKPGDCAVSCLNKKEGQGWYDCNGDFLYVDNC